MRLFKLFILPAIVGLLVSALCNLSHAQGGECYSRNIIASGGVVGESNDIARYFGTGQIQGSKLQVFEDPTLSGTWVIQPKTGIGFRLKNSAGNVFFSAGTGGNVNVQVPASDKQTAFIDDLGNTVAKINGSATASDAGAFNIGASGYLFITERAAPGTATANTVRLYVDSTTNDLMAQFDSGAAVTVAVHP